jgi:hypothetical protein
MAMNETVREMTDCVDKIMDVFKRKFGELVFDDYEEVDTDTLELMRNTLRLSEVSLKLVREQTETLEKIDRKLDMLLERH